MGEYGPGSTCRVFDLLCWVYGNMFSTIQASGGRSAYYDDTKNLSESVVGVHATNRARFSGNSATTLHVGWHEENWCTAQPHPTAPDPQPAGGIKPFRSFGGINYPADDPDDPDVGIKIRRHSGAIIQDAITCIDWVANLDQQAASAPPGAWLTDLLDEYPWIRIYAQIRPV